MPKWKGIIGRSFTPETFQAYVQGLAWGDWEPEFIVLHHTAEPCLANRPTGLTLQHLLNLQTYYRDTLGWSAGPHLFIDDRQIWVFTPLTTPGVHAKSFNVLSLGIEMLGNYDVESFTSGRGAQVRDLAVAAVAILSEKLNLSPEKMECHRDEPNTTKTCPGRNVDKAAFIRTVEAYLEDREEPPAPTPSSLFRPEELALARQYFTVFRDAANAYQFPDEVTSPLMAELGSYWLAWILMAIASRESRFGLLLDRDGKGDGGHGCGIMQIDDRWHQEFCASGQWQDLAASLAYVHKAVIIPSYNYLGGRFELFGEKDDYPALFWATISAYNAGPGNVLKALEAGEKPDSCTTGGDYAADVRRRAAALKEALV